MFTKNCGFLRNIRIEDDGRPSIPPNGRRIRGRPRISYLEYIDIFCKGRENDLRRARKLGKNRSGVSGYAPPYSDMRGKNGEAKEEEVAF